MNPKSRSGDADKTPLAALPADTAGAETAALLRERLSAVEKELELLPSASLDSPVCLAWMPALTDALAGLFAALQDSDVQLRDQLLACPAIEVCLKLQAELRIGAIDVDAVRARLPQALAQLRALLASQPATPAR